MVCLKGHKDVEVQHSGHGPQWLAQMTAINTQWPLCYCYHQQWQNFLWKSSLPFLAWIAHSLAPGLEPSCLLSPSSFSYLTVFGENSELCCMGVEEGSSIFWGGLKGRFLSNFSSKVPSLEDPMDPTLYFLSCIFSLDTGSFSSLEMLT